MADKEISSHLIDTLTTMPGWAGTEEEAEAAISALIAALPVTAACRAMADDYQTSGTHHPDHVLVPRQAFEKMQHALDADGGKRAEAALKLARPSGVSADTDSIARLIHPVAGIRANQREQARATARKIKELFYGEH